MIDTLGFFVKNILSSNSEAQNSTKVTSYTLKYLVKYNFAERARS